MHIGIMGTQASLLVLTAVFLRMLLLYRVPKRTFVFYGGQQLLDF